jgi:hypothetical protein
MSQGAMSARVRMELEWEAFLAVASGLAPLCVQPIQGPAIIGGEQQLRLNFDVTLLSGLAMAGAEKLMEAFLTKHPDYRLYPPSMSTN